MRHAWRGPLVPPTQFMGGVLVLDLEQTVEEADVVSRLLEYRLWLVDPDGGDDLAERLRRRAGARN